MKSTALRNMAVGKKYENKVQDIIEKYSAGKVYRNVWVGGFCEFDAVVEDYPLLTFIEIKRYRTDSVPNKVRTAVSKFKRHCSKIVDTGRIFDRKWYPDINEQNKNKDNEKTLFELLINKLEIETLEGWRFRLVLIVPNVAYKRVIDTLSGRTQKTNTCNLINMDGIPVVVIRETAINATFR
jgi:Holliday junction resolvase-like predicted endonuclease